MSAATGTSAPAEVTAGHAAITPSILYFGTPVVLLSTENENGSANLAPMSSAWALGQVIVLGLGDDGQTARNLLSRPDLVANLPGPAQWPAVERLAPLTGRSDIPVHKRDAFRYEQDKFAAAGLHPIPSDLVRPPRADPGIIVPGTQHIDPGMWSPLIYNFRHYFGLGAELGHSFRSQTPPPSRH